MPTLNATTHVLIGGAEGALGRAAVAYFARHGQSVVAVCRNGDEHARLAAYVSAERLDRVTLAEADLGDDASVARLVAAADARQPLDGVFNAAGGFRWVATTDCSVADFDFLFSANLRSCWLLAKHAVPRFKARGFGRLVFVSSRGTLGLGEANMGVYTASKAALNALVLGLAAELRPTNVTVNAVLATTIDTPANRQAMPDANPADWVSPAALLDVVGTLMGPVGTPINGALIPVAGKL